MNVLIWDLPRVTVGDGVHEEAHADHSDAVHQSRPSWRWPHASREDFADGGPEVFEEREHRFGVASPVAGVR